MIGAAVLAAAAVVTGTWSGSYTLPRGTEATAISVQVNRGTATVTLGSGHASDLHVAVSTTGPRLRFRIPGRPAWIAFDGKLRRGVVTGTVRQGTLRGTFRLVRGAPIAARENGLYALLKDRHFVLWDGFDNRLAADLRSGEIHGLRRTARSVYAIGAGLTDLRRVGDARVDGSSLTWATGDVVFIGPRIRILQEEVRVPSAPGSLACTFSRPARPGPMAAVAMVHGSGIAPRGIVGLYTGVFLDSGLAVLACDKRGNGQSSGPYPGERATVAAVDRYARDAEAQARFLAAQPEIDPQRVGLGANSQGGWIAPLAASREPAIRWLLMLVPPTITVDENDAYEELTTQGATIPARSPAEIDAEVLSRGPGGFDPLPVIRALRIPALWIFGALDQNVATNLSVARLDPIAREPGRDFSYVVLPRANHSLLETEHGLNEETARSHQMARDLFPTIRAWLRAHGL
jgi:dienelactone hydrolase